MSKWAKNRIKNIICCSQDQIIRLILYFCRVIIYETRGHWDVEALTLNIQIYIADPPSCIYSNNHPNTTQCRDMEHLMNPVNISCSVGLLHVSRAVSAPSCPSSLGQSSCIPASLHLLLSVCLTLCSAESCPFKTVARMSCTTVSIATSWQCHLAEGHVTAQPSGRPQQLHDLIT